MCVYAGNLAQLEEEGLLNMLKGPDFDLQDYTSWVW